MNRVRRLTRTNSALNLTEQLGVRGRPRLRRNNPIRERGNSRARSQSRNRLNRSNSKQNLRGRSASRSRGPIRLKRSNSHLNLNGNINNKRSLPRQRSRSRSNVRQNISVNARLGIKRQNNATAQRNMQNVRRTQNIRRGRIVKKQNPNNPNRINRRQIGNAAIQQQRGRSRSRFHFKNNCFKLIFRKSMFYMQLFAFVSI